MLVLTQSFWHADNALDKIEGGKAVTQDGNARLPVPGGVEGSIRERVEQGGIDWRRFRARDGVGLTTAGGVFRQPHLYNTRQCHQSPTGAEAEVGAAAEDPPEQAWVAGTGPGQATEQCASQRAAASLSAWEWSPVPGRA